MPSFSTPARLAAGVVALIAWIGLGTQLIASIGLTDGNVPAAVWAMLRYFTILTNLAVAIVMSSIALGRRELAGPALLGGVTLSIVLVGVVYGLLLRGLVELSGGAVLADTLNHMVTPVTMPLWWLVFAPKGGLRMSHPPLWALPPLLYFIYGLARGGMDGNYPYPFMDLATLGWGQTLLNAVLIAAGFMVAGYLLVLLDGWLSRRVRAVS